MEMNFEVVSMHITNDCNLDCPFCYAENKEGRPDEFWMQLVEEVAPYTKQIAVGGGEVLKNKGDLLHKMAAKGKRNGVQMNLTTNGKYLDELIECSANIDMISISYDDYKWNMDEYLETIKQARMFSDSRIGANILMTDGVFDNIVNIVDSISNRADRVYLLSMKNEPTVDILDKYWEFGYFEKLENVYVDECSSKLLDNMGNHWGSPCHYGTSTVCIDQTGDVRGCSFADSILVHLDEPSDITKLKDVQLDERFSCPYIKRRKYDG